ncbi:UNVERIFIED_CONTAM: Homeobox-DDT domain protein RLT3 [Sesamum latifolium]|uniref:Homeobox-DDT domain protein RLT3 n=1 Tax=Sesamum latifolium TaxID=2727402 RepID=A0AAW2TAQ9_9LAMI
MAKRKPNSNTQKCTQEFGNGLNSNVIHYSRRNAVGRKRKSKQHQQLFMSENDYKLRLQEVLYTPEYIFTKIFRKDGPPLGDHFDSLPSNAFSCGPSKSHYEDNRHSCKRRKVSVHAILDYQACCENSSPVQSHGIGKGPMTAKGAPIKKHGMGKGLMTQKGDPGKKHGRGKGFMAVWRGTNPVARDFAYGANSSEIAIQKKKNRVQPRESIARRLANKEQARRKTSVRSRKVKFALAIVERQKLQKQNQPHKEKCELALAGVKCLENTEQFAMLLDDEELELRDLQAGPKPLSCCAHFPTNASHGCSLCKGLLAKFPPNSVTMKLPLSIQPWVSSPELINKFFKVFHFLCTYAVTISIHSFTLDDFAQAFHDKESLLLGQVHLALLKLLLSDIDKELSRGFLSHASKNCKFLGLLHSLEHNGSTLEFWQKSLNLLTWTEILRQVLVAAGFGGKHGMTRKTICNKGELFSLLLTQGNSGMKVSELAKSSSIVELNLTDTLPDLENLITSALSGDITLFEKISSSGYRLRIHAAEMEFEDCPSDSEDFGSMDDISEVTGGGGDDAMILSTSLWTAVHPKFMLDHLMSSTECPPNTHHRGSGAKIKRSMVKQYDSLGLLGSRGGQTFSGPDVNIPEQPIDSLVPMSKIGEEETVANMKRVAKQMEAELYLHPMQSIFLGSDRRYNRYWLFLGPCDELDPGHRRIYFESSEDGHWEIIDTKEAFSTLLSVLDRRGAREARLLASLEERESSLIQAMSNMPDDGGNRQLAQSDQSELNTSREDSSSPVSDVDNRLSLSEMQNELPSCTSTAAVDGMKKGEQLLEKPGHSQAFGAWIWKSFYSELNSIKIGKKAYLDSLRRCDQCQDLYWRDEKHCRFCHTTFELDFDLEERYAVHSAVCQANNDVNKCRKQRVLSSQLQALKAAIYAIESAIPEDALMGSWKRSAHNLWVNRLRRASNLREFLQVLADLVTAIDEDWFYRNNIADSYCGLEEIISNFKTMPQTYSAVALWLVKLDSLIASRVESRYSQPESGKVQRLEGIHFSLF